MTPDDLKPDENIDRSKDHGNPPASELVAGVRHVVDRMMFEMDLHLQLSLDKMAPPARPADSQLNFCHSLGYVDQNFVMLEEGIAAYGRLLEQSMQDTLSDAGQELLEVLAWVALNGTKRD